MSKESYQEVFLNPRTEDPDMFSKSIDVLPSVIQYAKMVISTCDNPKVSLRSYLNNILIEHFKTHRSDVYELCNEFDRKFWRKEVSQ